MTVSAPLTAPAASAGFGIQFTGHARRGGRVVEDDGILVQAREGTFSAEHDAAQVVIVADA
jgi:hypothetical protein